jgi:NUMOD4 motif-containing protein
MVQEVAEPTVGRAQNGLFTSPASLVRPSASGVDTWEASSPPKTQPGSGPLAAAQLPQRGRHPYVGLSAAQRSVISPHPEGQAPGPGKEASVGCHRRPRPPAHTRSHAREDAVTEAWRPVPDWPGYEVSDLGRVRSLERARQLRVEAGR